MRVTPGMFVMQTIQQHQLRQARIADWQRQIATGLRIEKPSDEPISIGPLLDRKAQDVHFDTDLANIDAARAKLNLSVSALLEVKDILVRAKDIALAAPGSQQSHGVLATEIDFLLQRLVELANSADGGHFLFAGTAEQTEPFAVTETDDQGRPVRVEYRGAEDPSRVMVSARLSIETLYPGSQVFQQRQRGPTLVIGSTGAAAGTGTDNAVGRTQLTVRHIVTSFAPGSGVQAGTDSPGADTIIGPSGSHVLMVNDTSGTGASGTISLNGGPTFTFTSSDTNLQLVGPAGEVVYVDTTAVTPGFSGTVAITADGTMSVDGGLTEVPIDFSSDQIVTQSLTGSVTHIDSTNIRRVGQDVIEYSGTADVFETLIELRDDLRNGSGLSISQQEAALQRRVGDLDRAIDSVLAGIGRQSSTLESLDLIQQRTEKLQLELRETIGAMENADIPAVVLRFQNEQTLLQYHFAAAIRLMDQSLLDFIR